MPEFKVKLLNSKFNPKVHRIDTVTICVSAEDFEEALAKALKHAAEDGLEHHVLHPSHAGEAKKVNVS